VSIRIVLADDHKIVLDGLRSLLNSDPELEVVAEVRDGLAAVRAAQELRPDVVIIDVSLPKMNGIEATRQIIAGDCSIKVVALSMHSDQMFVMEMLKAGAQGYVLKDDDFDQLLVAVKAVRQGEVFLSPSLESLQLREYLQYYPQSASSPFALLSNRERELMSLLASGRSVKEIAAEMHVSPKTLYTHREHIMGKLNIHRSAELVKLAVQYF
jgi:two-component system response regulator NreC